MTVVAYRHLEDAYTGLKKSLQQEGTFMQRTTQSVRGSFRTVEKALREEFLLDLFLGANNTMPG